MFYIHKHGTYPKKDMVFTHIGPPLVVFVALMGLTLWSWASANRANQQDLTDLLGRQVGQTSTALQSRLEIYDNIIHSSAGLVGTSKDMSSEQWNTFIGTLDLKSRYPGITNVGYAQVTKKAGTDRVPVIYNTSTAKDGLATGYDMYSDAVRRDALKTARDIGTTVITPPTQSLRSASATFSLTMFEPVYTPGAAPATPTERQSRIVGYAYLIFQPHALIDRIISDDNPRFGFQIYDATESIPLYENKYNQTILRSGAPQTLKRVVSVENKQWKIIGSIDPNALSRAELRRPSTILWGGTLFSVLVAGSIYLLLLNRTRLLANHEAGEIQEAKDELLALASHQLRTPATGVKQYIGMLREGYAGPLTTEQQSYVDKAYRSNERQLGTINEMLVVAKADAGHLELAKTAFDLNQLIAEVIEEMTPSITARQQVITSYMPSEHIQIYADERFLRMAIENIVSNATKYTPDEGAITITLLSKKGKIHISIRDTGVGISRGDKMLLFQKFSRIPNELTNKVGGSGIGLYLAQKIIEQHDGKITYKSASGEGSVFTIVLPAEKATVA